MKAGVRTVGIAESFRTERSTLAGVVTRSDKSVDGFAFADCTVGGTDITDAIIELYGRLDREDIRYVMIAGVALAWFNIVDLHRLQSTIDRPVCAVTFEESSGLEPSLREAFSGKELDRRLELYRSLPERRNISINGYNLYYRTVGLPESDSRELLLSFTSAGRRPEPLRVARLAARAADEWIRNAIDV